MEENKPTYDELMVKFNNSRWDNLKLKKKIESLNDIILSQNKKVWVLEQKVKKLEGEVDRRACLGNGFEPHHIY